MLRLSVPPTRPKIQLRSSLHPQSKTILDMIKEIEQELMYLALYFEPEDDDTKDTHYETNTETSDAKEDN